MSHPRRGSRLVWRGLIGVAELPICLAAGVLAATWMRGSTFWLGVAVVVTALLLVLAMEVFYVFRIELRPNRRVKRARQLPNRLTSLSASSLTNFAVLLAGRSRSALRDEWRAHLGGESGHAPLTWRSNRAAIGFVVSGIKFRLADAADLAWCPADAVLRSRALSNLFVGGPVIVVLVVIVHHDGRFGLVADIQDPAALGAFLYGVIRTGRWWRGIKPPAPKSRRAQETDTDMDQEGSAAER